MVAELMKIDPVTNEYRIWRMVQENDVFRIFVNRAGDKLVPVQVKSMADWDAVLARKLAEGFVERTEYIAAEGGDMFKPIPDPEIRKVWESLFDVSRQYTKKAFKYTSIKDITGAQVDEGQRILDLISANRDAPAEWINDELLKFFIIVPRKTADLGSELVGSGMTVDEALLRNQQYLDVLRPQVYIAGAADNPRKTQPEQLGLDMRIVGGKELEQVLRHLDPETRSHATGLVIHLFNYKTNERFLKYMAKRGLTERDIHYLYHGSRNENIIGLMVEGAKLHANAVVTGKALGNGFYLADLAKKSVGYTDGGYWARGDADVVYLIVFKVVYNNPLITGDRVCSYNAQSIRPHDIVFFKGGKVFIHNEYVVFNEHQLTPLYLIQLRRH